MNSDQIDNTTDKYWECDAKSRLEVFTPMVCQGVRRTIIRGGILLTPLNLMPLHRISNLADQDIAAKRVRRFNSMDELIKDLESETSDHE